MVTERLFDSRAEMIAALQAECESALREAIEDRGEATFMVSGVVFVSSMLATVVMCITRLRRLRLSGE